MRAMVLASALVWVVGMAVSLNGCGADGSSGATLPTDPPQKESKLTGVVYAPNGVLAGAPRWWDRHFDFGIASPAYALRSVSPVASGLPVSLALLDAIDVADGYIDSPKPLVTAALTNDEGRFTIIAAAAEDVITCRKMVFAGGGDALTRAFVYSHEVQIDAASEALVRVLLDHLAASLSHLCNYNTGELTQLQQTVNDATFSAHGDTAAAINEDAYQRAKANRFVQAALVSAGS
jgi:hypothetical protein